MPVQTGLTKEVFLWSTLTRPCSAAIAERILSLLPGNRSSTPKRVSLTNLYGATTAGLAGVVNAPVKGKCTPSSAPLAAQKPRFPLSRPAVSQSIAALVLTGAKAGDCKPCVFYNAGFSFILLGGNILFAEQKGGDKKYDDADNRQSDDTA